MDGSKSGGKYFWRTLRSDIVAGGAAGAAGAAYSSWPWSWRLVLGGVLLYVVEVEVAVAVDADVDVDVGREMKRKRVACTVD